MTGVVFDFGDDSGLFQSFVAHCDATPGQLTRRQFPDGDTYLRFLTNCENQTVYLLCSLDRPDPKVVPLLLAAATLRSLGARHVILVAPYLAYMRQDKVFATGEGVNARYFGRLISGYFDGLVTVDPHLHRIHTLDEVYSIPSVVVRATPAIAQWIKTVVTNPVLLGPDSESAQWVEDIAARVDAPFLVLEKIRTGDREVSVSIPDLAAHGESTPVLIDDIISTGNTMIATLAQVRKAGARAPVCVAIHGVFASGSAQALVDAGASTVVTTNTITHSTNAIDISAALAAGCRDLGVGIMAETATAK